MKIRCFILLASLTSMSAFAGNSLEDPLSCDGTYVSNVNITGINTVSNWNHSGPALNVKINNVWYAKLASDSEMSGFYQMALSAYVLKEKINFCHSKGYIRGFELLNQ